MKMTFVLLSHILVDKPDSVPKEGFSRERKEIYFPFKATAFASGISFVDLKNGTCQRTTEEQAMSAVFVTV